MARGMARNVAAKINGISVTNEITVIINKAYVYQSAKKTAGIGKYEMSQA